MSPSPGVISPQEQALNQLAAKVLADSRVDQGTTFEVHHFEPGDKRLGLEITRPVSVVSISNPRFGTTHIGFAADLSSTEIQFSLGGFRHVSQDKLKEEGYEPFKDVVRLTLGMGDKIVPMGDMETAGPLGAAALKLGSVKGGKIVFVPRGQSEDPNNMGFDEQSLHSELAQEQLAWAGRVVAAFADAGGVKPITGQDLGQDETTLNMLNAIYPGVTPLYTAGPTAVGNIAFLKGALKGLGLRPEALRFTLIGAGKIGSIVHEQVAAWGAKEIRVVERPGDRAKAVKKLGAHVFNPSKKLDAVQGCDVLVINGFGGSLDAATLAKLAESGTKIVCGSENNPFPAESKGEFLKFLADNNVLYLPTEICGHLGGTAALEDSLLRLDGEKLNEAEFNLSRARIIVGRSELATKLVLESDGKFTFAEALKRVTSGRMPH